MRAQCPPSSAGPRRQGLGIAVRRFLAGLATWTALLTLSANACRYNVRDVGFVDLETEPYRLYLFVGNDTPPDVVSALTNAANASLRDCNVAWELVDAEQSPRHPHRPTSGDTPTAVLVSPDGARLSWPLPRPDTNFRRFPADCLEPLVASPVRTSLIQAVTQTFGAILLIEGTNSVATEQAHHTISEAIELIRQQMSTLPKPIHEAPVCIRLPGDTLATESVLLWSLGLAPRSVAEPRAAIFFGRARWIGPLMKDREISVRNLTGIFSIIGADCECGLDLSWTRGTRLPVRWPESLHLGLTRNLGFDPEHPLVKTEVDGILGRRPRSTPSGQPPAAKASIPDRSLPLPRSPSPSRPPPMDERASDSHLPASTHPWPTVALIAAAAASLATGVGIALRFGRRR